MRARQNGSGGYNAHGGGAGNSGPADGMAGEQEYVRFENDLQARLDVVGAQLGDVHAKFRDAVQRRDRVELALLDQARPPAPPGASAPSAPAPRDADRPPAPLSTGANHQGAREAPARRDAAGRQAAGPSTPPAARRPPPLPRAALTRAGTQHCDMRLSTYTKDFVTLTKSLGKSKGHVSAKEAEAALKMVESRPVRRCRPRRRPRRPPR